MVFVEDDAEASTLMDAMAADACSQAKHSVQVVRFVKRAECEGELLEGCERAWVPLVLRGRLVTRTILVLWAGLGKSCPSLNANLLLWIPSQ